MGALNEASFQIEPRRSSVSSFADELAAYCEKHDVPMAVLLAFQVALDEVLTNIIDYAHPEHPVSLIAIHVSTPPGGLEITIEDNGIAFNPLESDADPDLEQSLEERPIGGLGIHLVKSLMDTLEYRRQNNRNRLTLSKSLPDHGQ